MLSAWAPILIFMILVTGFALVSVIGSMILGMNVEFDKLILTIVTFTPALGALVLLFFNRKNVRAIRGLALAVAILTLLLSFHLIAHFDSAQSGFQFLIDVPWIASAGIDYHMPINTAESSVKT